LKYGNLKLTISSTLTLKSTIDNTSF